jgi:hypothetical protein
MSEEDFLARWSRRKREARAEPVKPVEALPEEAAAEPAPVIQEQDAALDLSKLPSIDEIDAATDITAFLRQGIPQDLSRAALRRAWASDPAIRDFVGLAENAWDFNDPTAMPGFGPLDCTSEQLAALVDRIVGGVREAVAELPEPSLQAVASAAPLHGDEARSEAEVSDPQAAVEQSPPAAALQPETAAPSPDSLEPARRRKHGGALPR